MPSSRPVHLVAAAGRLTIEQHIWAAIRKRAAKVDLRKSIAGSFDKTELEHDCKCAYRTVHQYVFRLQRAGYIEALETYRKNAVSGRRTWNRYRLVRDVGVDAPRIRKDGSVATLGIANESLWRAAKIIGEFDARELAAAASTDACVLKLPHAKNYVALLLRAGYLVLVKRARRGRGRQMARYRFVRSMNSGPKPPMRQTSGAVFDANIGRVIWQPEARR